MTTVGELLSPSLRKALCRDTVQACKACVALLEVLGTPPSQYAIGKTMVFMRTGLRAELERREVAAHACAITAVNAAGPEGGVGHETHFEQGLRSLQAHIHTVLHNPPRLPPALLASAFAAAEAKHGRPVETEAELRAELAEARLQLQGYASHHASLPAAARLPAAVWAAAVQLSEERHGRPFVSDEEAIGLLRDELDKNQAHVSRSLRECAQAAFGKQGRGGGVYAIV